MEKITKKILASTMALSGLIGACSSRKASRDVQATLPDVTKQIETKNEVRVKVTGPNNGKYTIALEKQGLNDASYAVILTCEGTQKTKSLDFKKGTGEEVVADLDIKDVITLFGAANKPEEREVSVAYEGRTAQETIKLPGKKQGVNKNKNGNEGDDDKSGSNDNTQGVNKNVNKNKNGNEGDDDESGSNDNKQGGKKKSGQGED